MSPSTSDPLAEDRKAFDAQRLELVQRFGEGWYAVFDQGKLVGGFDTLKKAINAGIRTTGRRRFFVRKITREPEMITMPGFVGVW